MALDRVAPGCHDGDEVPRHGNRRLWAAQSRTAGLADPLLTAVSSMGLGGTYGPPPTALASQAARQTITTIRVPTISCRRAWFRRAQFVDARDAGRSVGGHQSAQRTTWGIERGTRLRVSKMGVPHAIITKSVS